MASISKAWLLAALFAIVLCIFTEQANAFGVEVYDKKHFKGRSTTLDVRGCTDLPSEWDDVVSSIEPAQCVIIYKHPRCQGPRVRLEPYAFGTAYLREINFEDKLSSVAPCNFNNQQQRERDEY